MVNVAAKIIASVYLGLLKDDINAILVHWPPPPQNNFQVIVEKYEKN